MCVGSVVYVVCVVCDGVVGVGCYDIDCEWCVGGCVGGGYVLL